MTDKSEPPANGHEKTGGMRLTTTPGRVSGAVPWLILAVKYILMRNFFFSLAATFLVVSFSSRLVGVPLT